MLVFPSSSFSLCRFVAFCWFPHRCELRRLQPHPGRHLPHALHDHRRDQRLRSLHQPDRHRSSICRISSGNHQHIRDHSWSRGSDRYRILYWRSHPGGLEEGVLGRCWDQHHRCARLHDIWQRKDPTVGRHRRRESRGREAEEQVHLDINYKYIQQLWNTDEQLDTIYPRVKHRQRDFRSLLL